MLVVVQPVLLIVLFRYVFGGAVTTGEETYADFLIPGVFAANAVLVATIASVSIADDMSYRCSSRGSCSGASSSDSPQSARCTMSPSTTVRFTGTSRSSSGATCAGSAASAVMSARRPGRSRPATSSSPATAAAQTV
jgi:hypothetical protein